MQGKRLTNCREQVGAGSKRLGFGEKDGAQHGVQADIRVGSVWSAALAHDNQCNHIHEYVCGRARPDASATRLLSMLGARPVRLSAYHCCMQQGVPMNSQPFNQDLYEMAITKILG